MIKIDGSGTSVIKGSGIDLLAELTLIMKHLRELSDAFDDDTFKLCMETSKKTDKELDKDIKEMLSNIESLKESLKEKEESSDEEEDDSFNFEKLMNLLMR